MAAPIGNDEAARIALDALAWTLADGARADRLLALSGLDADRLRAGLAAGDPALLAAVLAFLEAHEPDLIAAARALDLSPAALIAAREMLER